MYMHFRLTLVNHTTDWTIVAICPKLFSTVLSQLMWFFSVMSKQGQTSDLLELMNFSLVLLSLMSRNIIIWHLTLVKSDELSHLLPVVAYPNKKRRMHTFTIYVYIWLFPLAFTIWLCCPWIIERDQKAPKANSIWLRVDPSSKFTGLLLPKNT